MSICPHCGAELRDNARFCTACMTPLNEKRMVPKWIFFPHRWLSVAAAVLALFVAMAVFPRTAPPMDISSYHSSISTAPPLFGDSTPAAADEIYPEVAPPHTEANGRPDNIHVYQPDTDEGITTEPYDWEVGKGTARNTTGTTSRTTSKMGGTATTTTTTTTTTATTTTRPYWYDATPGAVTEDDLPIEELEWTYEPIIATEWSFARFPYMFPDSYKSSTTRNKTASGVPLNQCIRVTGFKSPASNGIYRVPAMIDGKVVAAVDLRNSFTDKAVALTVQRIYFPPDMLRFDGGTDTCTNLERLYFTSPEAYFSPSCIPDQPTRQWGGVTYYFLTIYVPGNFNALRVFDANAFYWACSGNTYDAESSVVQKDECEKLYGGGGT